MGGLGVAGNVPGLGLKQAHSVCVNSANCTLQDSGGKMYVNNLCVYSGAAFSTFALSCDPHIHAWYRHFSTCI